MSVCLYRIETDGAHSTLHIASAAMADNAWFQCSAVNVAGTATSKSKLVVQREYRYFTVAEIISNVCMLGIYINAIMAIVIASFVVNALPIFATITIILVNIASLLN